MPLVLGGGHPMPVSEVVEVVNMLVVDEVCGVVGLRLVLLGRLRINHARHVLVLLVFQYVFGCHI